MKGHRKLKIEPQQQYNAIGIDEGGRARERLKRSLAIEPSAKIKYRKFASPTFSFSKRTMGVWGRFASTKIKNIMEYLIQSNTEFIKKNNLKGLETRANALLKGKKPKKKKRRKEKKRATIRSYKTYMTSVLWSRRKNRYFQTYGKICEACKYSKYVTLHHTIYRQNYGDEPDDEVVAMCMNCHNEFHKFCPAKHDMREETKQFLEDMWSITQGLKEYDYKDNT